MVCNVKSILFPKNTTVLDLKTMACVFFTLLFTSMSMTMVYSFLPQLVKKFGSTEETAGYSVGLIASVLYVGMTIFSCIWGGVADSFGKRKSIIISGISLILSTLAFGFSYNLAWTTVTRFLQGCSLGLPVIMKALVADLTDDTNIAIGLAFITASTSSGFLLGPTLGGYTSFPHNLYPNSVGNDSLFNRYPILLPNLVLVGGMVLCLIASVILLPKDKKNASTSKIAESDSASDAYHYSNHVQEKNVWNIRVIFSKKISSIRKSSIGQVLSIKEACFSFILYMYYSFVATGFDEILPLYAATSIEYNGYAFLTTDTGKMLLISSVVILILELSTIMPKIAIRTGPKKFYVYGGIMQAILFPVVPYLGSIREKTVFWPLVTIVIAIIRVSIAGCCLSVNILVNNSVYHSQYGSANGLAMTSSGIGRSISPAAFGAIFSWSMTNVKNNVSFPFNHFFTFITLSFISILVSIFVSRFPKSMEKKKVQQDEYE